MEAKYFKFIVIDDDSINNAICKAIIKSATGGYIATCFTNPVEGLDFVRNNYSDCSEPCFAFIFLDINMPQLDGWQWLEKFSKFSEKIKSRISIFILSSSVNQKDIEIARTNIYVKEFISKPLTKSKMLDIIETETSKIESEVVFQ